MKKSLERLQLDYIDVLQCELSSLSSTSRGRGSWDVILMLFGAGHRFDPNTPVEETVSRSSDVFGL